MERGRLKATAVGSSLAVLLALAPQPASADGNAGVHLHKVVDPVQLAINPNIGVTLGVDKSAAIPGDTLTYTAVVTNPTATFAMGGYIDAQAVASADAIVAYYWDELEVCNTGCGNGYPDPHWTGVAAFETGQSGYQPVTPPAVHTGMTFAAKPVNRTGVTYPTSGDPVLGTDITPTATATWTYLAKVILTPAQMGALSDPTQVTATRNVIHFEVTVRNLTAAQPYTDPESFANPFQTMSNPGAIHNITVTFTLPDGTTAAVGPTQVPGLGLLNPGGSVSATTTYKVPVPATRGDGETELAYARRLGALDGAPLGASAVASGTGFSGTVYATSNSVTTVENVPIVTIAKSGPQTVDAGTTEDNPLALSNIGGATASSIAVVDSVPGGGSGTVSGVPATLSPGGTASAAADFPVPGSQPEGNLTDTASVTWTDGNGNPYGSFTSSFTTLVHNLLTGGRLTLAPANAGPNPIGTTQQLTATLVDRNGDPVGNRTITLTVTGANPGTFTATTSLSGDAVFTYTGAHSGNDVAQATFSAAGVTLTSNTSSISWGAPLQPVAIGVVTGNFFPNPNDTCTFGADPSSTPAFNQQFPDILFNPATAMVPHNISGINTFTRPFTDLTVDVNGNYNGQIVAQGNGQQAGNGSLTNFYAELTGTFIANQPGDVTFAIQHDDGYIFGVGGGATRVNGDLVGNPPATPFNGYEVAASFNAGAAGSSNSGTATVHLPAAGSYPFELDYTECTGGELFLVLQTARFTGQTSPLSVYVGYADGLRPGGSIFPFPWNGSPNVIFFPGGGSDDGAIRFDNSGTDPITFDQVTVDIGPFHYDIWPRNVVLPPGQILILTGTAGDNFDTSDTPITCSPTGYVPAIHITVGGVVTTFKDTGQILNTGGIDAAVCGLGNESHAWTRIGGGGTAINTPLPPGASLVISPFKVASAIVGQNQTLTVSAMDGAGNPVANLPVTLQVFGPNAQVLTGTTLPTGLATFNYVGRQAGTDSIQASGFVGGLREISNLGSVTWTAPGGVNGPPPPTITSPSPADGTVVTKPVTVSATIAPPAGETITSWRVFYQALDPGPQVVIASGSGTPPANLATFDPTVLPNDTYGITVEATASNGGVQDVTTTVTVFGNLKPGRFITRFQDMAVPVNGYLMRVRRTYDSFDKNQGDFGVGWKVELANFRVAPNRILGAGGWTMFNQRCVLGLCFTGYKNSAPRFVTIVFPDQHTEVFDFTPQGGTNLFWQCTPAFTARGAVGTTSTLVPLDDTGCSYNGDGNLFGSGGGLYDPQRFQLTTVDGTVIVLNRTTGLESIADSSGNSLTVSSAGVTSSTGPGIAFTRDNSGRITTITGPGNTTVTYTYDSNGNLSASTDPAGGQTTYTYSAGGQLSGFSGPGRPQQTLEYDSSGRLVSVTDASGAKTLITNDVGAQQQVITDPNGEILVLTMDDVGDVLTHTQIADGTSYTTTRTYDSVGHVLTTTDPTGATSTATYDTIGDLLSLTDSTGRKSTMTYGSHGEVLTFTDTSGRTTTYAYDSTLILTSITFPDGTVETFTHDANGRMTSHHDLRGGTTTYAYDANGNLTSITDPVGRTSTFTYDALGRLLTETNPAGATTTYTYDGAGRLLSKTDALGGVVRMTYNPVGLQSSITDALGRTTSQSYDATGRLVKEVDPLGATTTFTYDVDGRQLTRTYPDGGVVASVYDGHGRLIRQTDQVGRATTYTYDSAGRTATMTSPNGAVTSYEYDGVSRPLKVTTAGAVQSFTYDVNGRLATVTDAAGGVTRYSYDSFGNQTRVVDPLGRTTTYTYDPAGDVLSITDPVGNVTTKTYDAAGELKTVTDGSGRTTTYGYDAAGNQAGVTDGAGHTGMSQYDALGRLIKTTSAAGVVTGYTYDAASQPASIVDGAGGMTSFAYDAAGHLVSTTDALGHKTTYTNDAVGRVASTTDPLGGKVTYAYDRAGELLSITDPVGHVTSFTYDAGGSVATKTSPATGTTTWRRDQRGRVTAITNARGQTTNYAYDAVGDLTSVTAPDFTVLQKFDAAQQRTGFTDGTGTTTFTYDADGRPTSIAATAGTIGYAYDGAGRQTAMTLPGGLTASSTYDAAGFLATVSAAGLTIAYTHDADGRTATVDRGSVRTSYTYDGAGRLNSVAHSVAGATVDSYAYTLDATGRRIGVTTPAGTESYTFDAAGRLTAATYPGGSTVTYTYDAAGNRTSQTSGGTTTSYTYDSAGRLTAAGAAAITYDADGNVVGFGSNKFAYDSAGRLTSSTVGGTPYANVYDGDGVRIRSTAGSTSTSYLVDRTAAVPEVVGDGTTSYVRDDSTAILAEVSSAGVKLPLADGLGSIRRLVDTSGVSTGTATYDAFGGTLTSSGAVGAFGFAGEAADPNGLIFLRAREYDPSTGRFMSPDPATIGAEGTLGTNPYVYAADDPVNRVDPTGAFATETALQDEESTAVTEEEGRDWGRILFLVFTIIVAALASALEICLLLEASICTPPQRAPRPGSPQPAPGAPTQNPDVRAATAQQQVGAAMASEEAAAEACAATKPTGPVNDPKSPCRLPRLKIFFSGADMPLTTQNDAAAIAKWPPWFYLVKSPGPGRQYRSWYDDPRYVVQDPTNPCFNRPRGIEVCDEYPFFTTIYGGPFTRPLPSLLPTPILEGRRQGGYLSSFYQDPQCGLVDYDVYRGGYFVVPTLLAAKTFWICNQ
jgi:RHS repeat-associated protein